MKRCNAPGARRLATCTIAMSIAFLAACDDRDGRLVASEGDEPAATSTTTRVEGTGKPRSRSAVRSSLDRVRARADAAFAEIPPGAVTRSESRIGPQPWPADLPAAIAPPADARVVADTRRAGERLLLVDLPGPVERAAEAFGESLRASGYRVSRVETRRIDHTLYARADDLGEAVLTFSNRDAGRRGIRVELLFLHDLGATEPPRDG